MKIPQNIRFIFLIVFSVFCLQLIYHISLKFCNDGGKLTEFSQLTLGLLMNIYSSLFISKITTGKWIPPNKDEQHVNLEHINTNSSGINKLSSISFVTITWIITYFFTELLIKSSCNFLYYPLETGVSISENCAMRIGTMFIGTLYIGSFFPLIAVFSFLSGWSSKDKFSYKIGLIPSSIFFITAFLYKSGQDILKTGYPPGIDALNMIFHLNTQHIVMADLVALWILTCIICIFFILSLSVFFFIWSRIGYTFRKYVN